MTAHTSPMPEGVSASADALVREMVANESSNELSVGFTVLHHGVDGIWLLVDLWRGDVICQRTYRADHSGPKHFAPVQPGGPTVCVWEVDILVFERDAYVRHVLDAVNPDTEAYIADRLDIGTRPSHREMIEEFDRRWCAGDVDGLMSLMSPDPTYRASTGEGPGGTFVGRDDVRDGFAHVVAEEAQVEHAAAVRSFIHTFGDRGLSSWAYTATTASGDTAAIEGVDVWTFENGLITVKDAYRKSFRDQ